MTNQGVPRDTLPHPLPSISFPVRPNQRAQLSLFSFSAPRGLSLVFFFFPFLFLPFHTPKLPPSFGYQCLAGAQHAPDAGKEQPPTVKPLKFSQRRCCVWPTCALEALFCWFWHRPISISCEIDVFRTSVIWSSNLCTSHWKNRRHWKVSHYSHNVFHDLFWLTRAVSWDLNWLIG